MLQQQHKRASEDAFAASHSVKADLINSTKDQLPEMLWFDCLLVNYEFNEAGKLFHRTVDILDQFVPVDSKEIITGLVSSFSLMPYEKQAEIRQLLRVNSLEETVFPEEFKHAISLYEQCPMAWLFADWRSTERVKHEMGLRYLQEATARLLASYSKHATRCRMFALSRMANRGKIIFVKGATDELIEDLCAYSDAMPEEDQARTEASVRAMFGGIFSLISADARTWSDYFWRQNYTILV